MNHLLFEKSSETLPNFGHNPRRHKKKLPLQRQRPARQKWHMTNLSFMTMASMVLIKSHSAGAKQQNKAIW